MGRRVGFNPRRWFSCCISRPFKHSPRGLKAHPTGNTINSMFKKLTILNFGLSCAFVFLSVAAWMYRFPSPSELELFQGEAYIVSGPISAYKKSKGQSRFVLNDPKLGEVYLDCKLHEDLCYGNAKLDLVQAEVVKVKNHLYWPINIKFSSGLKFTQRESSISYKQYLSKESFMFWIFFIAGVFMVFISFVFRNLVLWLK